MNTINNDNNGAEPPRLDFITPRETARLRRAREGRFTRRVARLRVILPIVAGLLLLALMIVPAVMPKLVIKTVINNVPDLVISNLHFTGVDDKNEPYSLLAQQATKPTGLTGIYDLTKPEGEITLQSGAWLAGKSLRGRYDQESRKLWLGGDVQLYHDKGYQFTTDEAQVDLNENNAWGEKPVLIQGDFGTIRGQGFRLLDSGDVVVIKGPAKALLTLRQPAGSDKANTNQTDSHAPSPAPDSVKK
jgi:lipopolysaccharide export system protein LptC